MKIVVLDGDSLGENVNLDGLRQLAAEVVIYPATGAAEVAERIRDADAVAVNKVVIGASELHAAPRLKWIAVMATGTNNIDLAAAADSNIRVANVIRYGRATIVQHTFSLIFALSNHLLDYVVEVRAGKWQQSNTFCLMNHPIRELEGKTLAVIGFGDLGQGVAEFARSFGMNVIIGARPGQPVVPRGAFESVGFDDALARADVLSLHCLLSDDTQHMIGAAELARMKSDALLINVARGGLVDEQALADALRNGQLAGAATDVLTSEPPVAGNVLLADDIPNLIVTPHCAWASKEARQRVIDKTVRNLACFLNGTSPESLVV